MLGLIWVPAADFCGNARGCWPAFPSALRSAAISATPGLLSLLSALGRHLHKPDRLLRPHLASTLGTGSAHRPSVIPGYSPVSWASPTSFNCLQHLEKLLEALLLHLVCFTCAPACLSLSLKICQSFQKQELFFLTKPDSWHILPAFLWTSSQQTTSQTLACPLIVSWPWFMRGLCDRCLN